MESTSPTVATSNTPAETKEKQEKIAPKPGPLLLNSHNFLVLDFISKEESRYTLNGMLAGPQGSVATNGHVAVKVSLPEQKGALNYPKIRHFEPDDKPKPFIIPLATAKKVAAAIPKKQKISILNHCAVGKGDEFSLELAVTDIDNTQVFQPRRMTGTFPNTEELFESAMESAVFEIAMDPIYLMQIAKAAIKFQSSNARHSPVLIRFAAADEALAFYANNYESGQTMAAIAMPMRSQGPDFGLPALGSKPPMAPKIPTAVPNIEKMDLGDGKKDETPRDPSQVALDEAVSGKAE